MKAFNQKCDNVLLFLKSNQKAKWETFINATGIKQNDGIIAYLKKHKMFIDYDDTWVELTPRGKDFITTSSFIQERDDFYL